MPIIKIPTVNDSYTGHVTKCEEVAGKFGEQVSFEFANGDKLFMPLTSATNQLVRAGFDAGGNPPKADLHRVAGNTLHFSRTPNKTPGASPYYNIEIATGAAPAPSKRLVGPATVPGDTPERYKPKAAPQSDPFDPGPPEPQDYPVRGVSGSGGTSMPRSRQQVAEAYAWCVETAIGAQSSLFPDGLNPTADSIQAGAATLLIQLERTGLLFVPLTKEEVKEALDLEEIFG